MEKILGVLSLDQAPVTIVLIAVGLIAIYTAMTVLLMSYILFNRVRLRRQARRDEQLIARHETEIFEMILEGQKRTDPRTYRQAIDRLRAAFTGASQGALRELLTLLGRDFAGEGAETLHEFYQDMRLDMRATQILRDGRWDERTAAVKELAYFGVSHAIPQLHNLAEDKHPVLRTEAQCALLRLGGADQLDFLATLEAPITLWQQLRITNVLRRFGADQMPDFQKYLANPHASVTVFVLKMIHIYGQIQAREQVIERLFDNRPVVRQEAVNTIADWLDEETVEMLMTLYEDGSHMHLSVVRALQQWTYDQPTRTFLENVVAQEPGYTLRMSALQSLKSLGGREAIAPLADTLDEAGQRYVVHQLDDRIQ